MEFLTTIIDFIVHIDEYLTTMVRDYGAWTYLILFVIIFCETGLVVTPFLPGDSLLFAAGALSAGAGGLHPVPLLLLLTVAAILGDTVNYWIGSYAGVRAFDGRNRFLKPEYLERTQRFYDKYGGKTIILARFVPIVRTYAPFVAGACKMSYPRFLFFNITGGIAWIGIFVLAGYFFGNIPFVQENFGLVVVVIILLSVVPMVVEYVKHRRMPPTSAADPPLP
ncbi:MAG: DedA family protein [Gemmatimonadota bacterium]|nr:DedA family protein [Gemmatimonadota bacterium]